MPTRPHPDMLKVWLLRAFLGSPLVPLAIAYVWIPLLVAAAEGRLSPAWGWMALVVPWVSFLVWASVYWPLYHARYRFEVLGDSVLVKRGVWFRRTAHIPLARVQDVVVKEGPLLGAFGLVTLHLQTAAQGQSNRAEGRLPGVHAEGRLAEAIMARIRSERHAA